MKKKFSLTLAFMLLLVSCGQAADTETTAPESTTEAPETTKYVDSLPELNFGGETFTISTYENADARNQVFAFEETGETLNDAIYQATLSVSQRFNVKFEELAGEATGAEGTENTALFRASVMAGDNNFDAATCRAPDSLTFYSEGLLTNFDELDYIDLTKPYYAANANSALSVGGVNYTALGDMNISAYDLTHVLLFNEALLAKYKLESPFDLVDSGKWTFDRMYEMMTAVSDDLNGDGNFDENDQYGYAGYARVAAQNFWIAGGINTVAKDKDDNYVLNLSGEKTIDYLTKFTSSLWTGNVAYFNDVNGWYTAMPDWETEMFKNDRVLFANTTLRYTESLRDMNTDFGIIPYPKQDEAQDKYYVRLGYWNATLVPVTNNRLEMTGALIEALNAEYYRLVRPAYIDIALKGKVSRNDESIRMLDLILDSRTIDIGDVLFSKTIRATLTNQFMNKTTDFASSIASNQGSNEAALEAVLKK